MRHPRAPSGQMLARPSFRTQHVLALRGRWQAHLTDSGTVVPAGSHPAHIQFNWKHFSLKNHLKTAGGMIPTY